MIENTNPNMRPMLPTRRAPETQPEHEALLMRAFCGYRVNPYRVFYHYCHAALKFHGENISVTARALGMERRQLQRILNRKERIT